MNCISWNIRGHNSPEKKGILKSRVLYDDPDLLLIQEMKLNLTHPPLLLNSCFKPSNSLANTGTGTVGGIMNFWKNSKLDLISSLATHHSLTVIMRITCTY